jgi:ActR/RegA family two-component response regulator
VKLDNEPAFIDEATELAINSKKLSEIRANAFESIANLDWDRIHEAFEMILRNVIASTIMVSKKIFQLRSLYTRKLTSRHLHQWLTHFNFLTQLNVFT